MPNHVTNVIRAPKAVIDALVCTGHEPTEKELEAIAENVKLGMREPGGHEDHVDFNRVIPTPDDIFLGAVGSKEEALYGDKTWWHWNRANWGTKWNAYRYERVSETELRFETAWSHPSPVIAKLALDFPLDPIEVLFADEDLGYNLGHYQIYANPTMPECGVRELEQFAEGSNEAKEFASQLKYGEPYVPYEDEEGDEE